MGTRTPYDILMHSLPDAPASFERTLPDLDRTPAPWEGRVQATCECLSWCGTLDHLERRHAEDELGETVYARFPVHARSVLVTAHSLLDQGVISEEELEAKMKEVRSRFESA